MSDRDDESSEPRPAPLAWSAAPAERLDAIERAHRTCPICGAELADRKCKLYCPRPGCGYFLSCADYY